MMPIDCIFNAKTMITEILKRILYLYNFFYVNIIFSKLIVFFTISTRKSTLEKGVTSSIVFCWIRMSKPLHLIVVRVSSIINALLKNV